MADQAIAQIYDKLVQVLGGTNDNQFFTMMMPGSMLNQSDFMYDPNGPKPAAVAEAESRLADQMFDIVKVAGGSNGQRVSSQYLQALSVLVPRFNSTMPIMKSRLRALLATPAHPDAKVDGRPFTGSLQEWYFALYESWLAKKAAWDKQVVDNRQRLSKEKSLEWYEEVAEGQLALIDAAEGRLVSVFSPADMDAIIGALNAGPGGELQEARDQVLDARVAAPGGGFTYPVELTPSDWFLELTSDQDPVDLLDEPQFVALTLAGRRRALLTTISQVQAQLGQMPTGGTIAGAAAALSKAEAAHVAAQNDLANVYAENTVTAVEMYLAAESGGLTELDGDKLNGLVHKASTALGENPVQDKATKRGNGGALNSDDLGKLLEGQKKLVAAQSNLLTSATTLATAGRELAADQARSFGDLPAVLARLQAQLDELTALQSQFALVAQRQPASRSAGAPSGQTGATAAPSPAADRWMDLRFSFSHEDMLSSSSQASSSAQASVQVHPFLWSAGGTASSSGSDYTSSALSENSHVEVGLKASKVEIVRGWFDPGVFRLSKGMHRLTDAPVSTGRNDLAQLADRANEAILPCFPVAFVVVKDVSIRFEAAEGQMSAVKSVLDSRAAVGGGNLCFSASASAAVKKESSSLSTRTEGNTVTINMPGAQILGWFCEFVPEDRSTTMSSPQEPAVNGMDIVQFAEALLRLEQGTPMPVPPATVPHHTGGQATGPALRRS
ncbi:hypothetical protein [Micromonospora humida]|uniref:hypothetical protein n=1 Tax=Micromonospora humida TaxID=2809018 RepID=UPI00342D4136